MPTDLNALSPTEDINILCPQAVTAVTTCSPRRPTGLLDVHLKGG